MLTIKCNRCGSKLFKYVKIGKGRLLHCWKTRIIEDFSIHNGAEWRCPCGNIIGVDEGEFVKLKKSAVTYTGTKH